MRFNQGPGRFIVIEGLDGAGTTTQARQLHEWLSKATGTSYLTQEPSQGPAGAQIRSILTHRLKADPQTLALLFATDRLDHLYSRGGVIHQLEGSNHIICDRYYLSSLAYQSLDIDNSMRWIYQLNDLCIQPDLTLFLEVPSATCMRRIGSRGFHYELYEQLEKLSRVNECYKSGIEHLRKNGENIHIVKGDLPVETVHNYIKERVSPLLNDDWLPLMKQRDLLNQATNRPLSFFIELVIEEKDLHLLAIKTINSGYQVLLASSDRERPVPVNFFPGTGRIVPQGPLDLNLKLKELALEAQARMYTGRLF